MTNLHSTTVRGFLAVALLMSASIVRADIHDRIEYKLNRVLKDVEIIINGNTANCTPITQLDIDEGGGVFTITESGEYCVTHDVTGLIVVDADCVCIDLNCHTVDAGGGANAFAATGHEGLKIANGCITNSSEAAIALSDYSAVELYNLHIHDYLMDGIDVLTATDLSVHDVDFINDDQGERAVLFDTVSNIAMNRCNVSGFLSTIGAVVQLQTCNCGVIQDVNVSGNTKQNLVSTGVNDMRATFVGLNTCKGVDLVQIKVNNNTINNTNAGNRRFNAIGCSFSDSCWMFQCETCNNTDIAGGALAADRMLWIGSTNNVLVVEHQANNNRCTQPILSFYAINTDSKNVVLDGCQANHNFLQELAVSASAFAEYEGIKAQNPFGTDDIMVRNCQANYNSVANGGAGRVVNGRFFGIHVEGNAIVDNCQANHNSMGNSLPNTTVSGINSLLSSNVTIKNCSAESNSGGETTIGIFVAGIFGIDGFNQTVSNCSACSNGTYGLVLGDYIFAPGTPAKNILVTDCVFNRNGSATHDAAGILIVPSNSSNILIKGCQINETTSGVSAAGINVAQATNVVIEDTNVYNTTSDGDAHGILFDTLTDSKIIRTQVHGNQNSGVELVGDNTDVSIIECIAKNNDIGFDFTETSTATCCLVQDSRALSNLTSGFVHATTPLTTTFIGNEAQCNGADIDANYVISGGTISLQELSWSDGNFYLISGNGVLGARFVNLIGSPIVP